MPQKSKGDYASIHESQIFRQQATRRRASFEGSYSTASDPATEAITPVVDPGIGVGANAAMMKLYRSALDRIYSRSNVMSWELTSPFTINAGPGTRIIPFNNENIGGHGAHYVSGVWWFQPPVEYAGEYRVSAYLEFLAGALANFTCARLEIWIETDGVARRWRVLDKVPLDTGDVDDDAYLEQIILGHTTIVSLECGERMTVRLYGNNTNQLVISDMNSVYGYVDLEYLGCGNRRTDLTSQFYLLPDNI